MFSEYEKVRIKETGIIGTIVDISDRSGVRLYAVESDTKGPLPGGYGEKWPLFNCTEGEIESIEVLEYKPGMDKLDEIEG